MNITLIGLGIGENGISKKAESALEKADSILVRSQLAQSYKSVEKYAPKTLDDIFKSSRNFDTLNKKLASAVILEAKKANVCYCVDGAVCEDAACKIILSQAKDVEVIEGTSKVAYAANIARIKSMQVTGISAYDIKSLKSTPACVVYDMDNYFAATDVKIKLSDLFGEESDCSFIRAGECKKIKVYEIDRQKDYDMTCSVAVEERDFLHKERYDYADLLTLISMLRAPDGCPWDKVQTNESIRINMIEEAYELVDAINKGDDDMIEEETGDVLLQAAFHTIIKEEQGAFNGTDVLSRVIKKLIFRHSHIFGSDRAKDEQSALGVWEKNKQREKHRTTYGEDVASVPVSFPACMRAQKVQKRAAKAGFDCLSSVSAAERLNDDITTCINALTDGDKALSDRACADILFNAVNLCRLAGVDCEQVLADAAEDFARRFIKAEELAIADGKNVSDFNDSDWKTYFGKADDALKKG